MTNHIHTSFSIFGIILIASSCSQEDVARVGNREPGERIEFMASLPEVASRATALTAESLDGFQVCAFTSEESGETPYFEDKAFRRNDDTGMYVCYDPKCVWPNNNDLLRFVAFSPSCGAMSEAGGAASITGDKLTGFKVAPDIASQFDFVTAITTGRLLDDEESGLRLSFRHQLSRIMLKAWGNSESYDLEIAGVRIGGVGTEGTFSLVAQADADDATQAGVWESVSKGYVEYIFRTGDQIVTIDGSSGSPISKDVAMSIMGAKIGGPAGYDNSAMIIPSNNGEWQYKTNPANGTDHVEGMYISVLMRVTDDTPYETQGSLVYPYDDNAEATNIVHLAIDKTDGKTVKTRLYKVGGDYLTNASDPASKYDLTASNAEAKAFGWAAFPVRDELKPGLVYTYTLNYSNGVGLSDPNDPIPGKPIISDKVLVDVEVTEWQTGADKDVEVPRR